SSRGDLMKIEVSGFLELSATLVELMKEMGIDPAGFLRDRLVEAVESIEEKIANELQILSPCLTSDLSLEVVED
ncbi:unnamed protein product, partial [marine sediment metagenome]